MYFAPIAAHKPLSCRQFDTCVLFFYIFISANAVISHDRIMPDKEEYPLVSQKHGIAIPPMGHRLEARGWRVLPF